MTRRLDATSRGRAACAALACAALLAGCTTAPLQGVAAGAPECIESFARVDRAVSQAGVGDALAIRLAGFPYLRADRFLASYARDELDDARHAEWVRRMQALGSSAQAFEVANLPARDREALMRSMPGIAPGQKVISRLAECAARLAEEDLSAPARRKALRDAVAVPDDYATWQRVAGLYVLTRVPFALGVRRWHGEVREMFDAPLAALAIAGEIKRYASPGVRRAPAEVAAIIARASANPLGIPSPEGADLEALFETFAPIYAVDTASDADIPGPLAWGDGASPSVAPGAPVVYRRVSHARHEGHVLLQLNYWLWFPQRPQRGAWDLLGGRLDGLLWRVTLTPRGEPLLFDTIHPCGCYHLFVPTARAFPRNQPPGWDEPAFSPQALPALAAGAYLELRIASGSHYLQRVVVREDAAHAGIPYAFAEDDSLRSLPHPRAGRRSIFRPDGIIPGTERRERTLFWPMGVAQAGSMRQWGHHATAFVGRRHFDDPALLSRYFDLVIIP